MKNDQLKTPYKEQQEKRFRKTETPTNIAAKPQATCSKDRARKLRDQERSDAKFRARFRKAEIPTYRASFLVSFLEGQKRIKEKESVGEKIALNFYALKSRIHKFRRIQSFYIKNNPG